MSKRKSFSRPLGNRRYKKIFIIESEGNKTERNYFKRFENSDIGIIIPKRKITHSSPLQVLRNLKKFLKKEIFRNSDEAWLVVDKDNWSEDQLKSLMEWSKEKTNYGFALNNPCFEYWLLLHFENRSGILSSHECYNLLKQYFPDYEKNIDLTSITQEQIQKAVERARAIDNPPCENWPLKTGTTVYRLVEKLIKKA